MTCEQSDVAAAFARQRAAMAVKDTTAPEKAVLLVLAIMANAAGAAWPPIAGPTGIAARASLSRRGVQEALRSLEAKGYVTREDRPGRGAVYTLQLEVRIGRACAPDAHVRPAHGGCAPGAPKQLENNHRRKKTSSSPSTRTARNMVETLPELPPGTTEQQWTDYVEMRVAMSRGTKGRPWTPGVARKAVEKLHALAAAGNDPGAVLDQSVLGGWQGLFPVRNNHGQRTDGTGGRGGASFVRDRPVDGFTAALRAVQTRAGPDHDRGGR